MGGFGSEWRAPFAGIIQTGSLGVISAGRNGPAPQPWRDSERSEPRLASGF